MEKKLPSTPLKTVPGTRRIHQVVTYKNKEIMYRDLSCFCTENNWNTGKLCTCHFLSKTLQFHDMTTHNNTDRPMKRRKKKVRYEDIYSSSDSVESEVELKESSDDEMTFEDLRNQIIQNESENLRPELMELPSKENIVEGTFILVDFLGKCISNVRLYNNCQIFH